MFKTAAAAILIAAAATNAFELTPKTRRIEAPEIVTSSEIVAMLAKQLDNTKNKAARDAIIRQIADIQAASHIK